MKFNTIDTATFDRFRPHWPTGEAWPSDAALGIALCMPSVSEGGQRAQRGGRVSGFQALYHALALSHGDGDPARGCRDDVWARFQLAYNAAAGKPGTPSNKTNHMKWLTQAGLITTYYSKPVRFSFLTAAGIDEVKAVGGSDLAKLAKGYTAAAREKAIKAAEKAAKAAAKAANEPVPVEPVSDDQPVEAPPVEPVSDDQPGFTA